ncbi:MAG TPA: integrase arm-type DNA-binding domain-containing protein [Steroidobacteraceae bacterium]|jgi:integrase|nr:integrase arm-type DNA-binding domain-containing protein [Steroidobacteraceae bacterium]
MALTETKIRSFKATERPVKLFDGGGLYLLVNPAGGRWWRLKYRHSGRERGLSLGVYPEVTLKDARERRDAARRKLANGIDPGEDRRAERNGRENTFESISQEWIELQEKPSGQSRKAPLAPVTVDKIRWMLDDFLIPAVGRRPITSITASDLLATLRKIEIRGKHETAHRTKQLAGRVFRYAVATGRALHDPTGALRGALAPIVVQNRAAVTDPARVGELLRAIDAYQGQPMTASALKLAPLVFVRPGELRAAEWSEIDLEAPEWRIPASRMKMREAHVVPLSTQAVAALRDVHRLTGSGRYVFPSLRSRERPMSENTVNAALRRLGYSKDEMTGHGFRALASTRLNEMGWAPDVIELQLAHAERNKVRAAYNRASRLPERRKMMQAWADYLDGLRASGNVVPIKRSA